MPPKKGAGGPDPPKKKDHGKVADDKTFGLKNKKGAKQQKFVQTVQQQAKSAAQSTKEAKEKAAKKAEREAKKTDAATRQAELDELFKGVEVEQKVPPGVDPKSLVCENFKKGSCKKGDRCRFSHDLEAGRRTQKKDLYTDDRDIKAGERLEKALAAGVGEDDFEDWDLKKLESVVLSKHGNPKTTTDIVCKFFIQAIEEGKYGWRWQCENGDNCKYKHALPPGFVLKQKKKKGEEEAEKVKPISLEDFLETERHRLFAQLQAKGEEPIPVTLKTFDEWKKTRLQRKESADAKDRAHKAAAHAAGARKIVAGSSGRDIFDFDPTMLERENYDADDVEWDLSKWRRDEEEASQAGTERDDESEAMHEGVNGITNGVHELRT